jgi:hypothetical protein
LLVRPAVLLMILQPARICRFCHHRLRLAIDYTPGHHDDQGHPEAWPARLLPPEHPSELDETARRPRWADSAQGVQQEHGLRRDSKTGGHDHAECVSKIRAHGAKAPGQSLSAELFTRRLLCQLSYTGDDSVHGNRPGPDVRIPGRADRGQQGARRAERRSFPVARPGRQMPSIGRGSGRGGRPGARLQAVCGAWAGADGVMAVAGWAARRADAKAFPGRKRARRLMFSRCV